MLKICYRQYQQYSKVQTMLKNNLISAGHHLPRRKSLVYQSAPRDGSEKWWTLSLLFGIASAFVAGLRRPYYPIPEVVQKHGYNFSEDKALDIYASACRHFGVIPKTDTAKLLVEQAISSTPDNFFRVSCSQTGDAIPGSFSAGVSCSDGDVWCWPNLGPQLLAEIGDVRRFHSKKALVAFAGIDAPPYQSGQIDVRSRSISKRGSASLRRTLFLVMSVILQCAPIDEPVYQFMDKKRSEGKPYRVYMMASANKFLRIYYASVKAYLESLEHD